ncbi:hypothetical protein C8Q69DRAFT_481505 [Paecilomyces variotii]|uniref:Secreted protein n=1 Tax=Byssochlamys spectabilis TaxID=264951 RepID=A0A443HIP5_BYSSP|nr:hypothetical protein C8Q69DRAFT_481505 [Paecilomyces variotii]RWQ91712.1 hypothetical protein C8Q69DRAFT_481505 [Paecilomyces variotii]
MLASFLPVLWLFVLTAKRLIGGRKSLHKKPHTLFFGQGGYGSQEISHGILCLLRLGCGCSFNLARIRFCGERLVLTARELALVASSCEKTTTTSSPLGRTAPTSTSASAVHLFIKLAPHRPQAVVEVALPPSVAASLAISAEVSVSFSLLRAAASTATTITTTTTIIATTWGSSDRIRNSANGLHLCRVNMSL